MNKLKKIDLETMDKIIKDDNSLFLCGNGFSMNFDSDFGNIFDRLYQAHKSIVRNGEYEIARDTQGFKGKSLKGYKNVLNYTKYFSEDKIRNIFKDGHKFAQSIINNRQVIEELKEKEFITDLTFGRSEIDLVKEIYGETDSYSIESTNIEYWTILIYFYFALRKLQSKNYKFPVLNSFLTIIEIGHVDEITFMGTNKSRDIVIESTLFNGFNTYYRLLFCTAIFSNGKALQLEQLNKISKLSIKKIQEYLGGFNSIVTLNYDSILDMILPNSYIYHPHGSFINKKEYVHGQSLGLNYDNNKYVSFSDILIGDYFYNKTYRGIINNMAKNSLYNKKPKHIAQIINSVIKEKNIDAFIIFGMNIQNDQHVIRNIMTGCFFADIENPKIIYCYYNEEEALQFQEEFKNMITFSEDASEYAKNIDVQYIDTHDILDKHFNK
ncbi:hypothetical protein G8S21_05505 [Clostridium botulinum C]|uniref:hypothetical protein n=1 Tax=Clostridium botulinum TaxID=1491 RepID=UPI001E61982A|nr:hypothetical protein [Clostridium botulinum]MCD3245401.1 hypothetical protein [Clostridium botulinum C]MCD3261780.1 hypothetical protein [Clostridium botulinum C]